VLQSFIAFSGFFRLVSIILIKAEPITMPSQLVFAISAAFSAFFIPKPTQIGNFVADFSNFTDFSTSFCTADLTPVTPATAT
jgi:hypothetical protein